MEQEITKKPMSIIAKVNWWFFTGMGMIYLLFALVGGISPMVWTVTAQVFFIILEIAIIAVALSVNIESLMKKK